jgi:hypothetical protein
MLKLTVQRAILNPPLEVFLEPCLTQTSEEKRMPFLMTTCLLTRKLKVKKGVKNGIFLEAERL